jgi:hypothetical protein
MQESRELHTPMDSRIRGNDGDGLVTKANAYIAVVKSSTHVAFSNALSQAKKEKAVVFLFLV